MLKVNGRRQNGYLESDDTIVTWCVGHLVTMSYPEKYDLKYKRWALETLPFLPDRFLYEVIGDVKTQFEVVSGLLNRDDVDTIYICTDSGGSTPRPRRRSSAGSGRRRTGARMTVLVRRLISAPRKTTSWESTFPVP